MITINSNNTDAERATFLEEVVTNEVPLAPPRGGIYTSEEDMIADLKPLVSVLLGTNQVRLIIEKGDGFELVSEKDAGTWLKGFQLEIDTPNGPRTVAGLPRYLKHPECVKFMGITTDPAVPRREGSHYTTWRGISRKARRGPWARMHKHIRDVICGGNEEHYRYLMSWMAQMIQQPGEKLGTAVVLRGPRGCGKTTLGYFLRQIVGPHHSRKVSQGSHVTGHFNQHMRDCLFLLVEEGVWGGDKKAEGVLKDLITGDTAMIEGKGVNIFELFNYTRLMITSNAEWIVPAGPWERRYFILDVLDPFPELAEDDPARKAYFDALYAEAHAGGLEAMLAELMEWDHTQVNLRKPPVTAGLKAQMAQTFTDEEDWLLSSLIHGHFTTRTGDIVEGSQPWPLDKPLEIQTAHLIASYRDHVRTYSGSAPGTRRMLQFLKASGTMEQKRLTMRDGGRMHGYVLAPRSDWRERFTLEHKYEFDDSGAEILKIEEYRDAGFAEQVDRAATGTG